MNTESKDIRKFRIESRTTDTFGRLLCSARHHHFVIDGPAQNGCPGEALTPPEVFLAGVVACGVELVEVFARQDELPLESAHGVLSAVLDRSDQLRTDVTLFNSVLLEFTLKGVTAEQGKDLVERFKKRCPLFGTLAVATPNLKVEISIDRS